MTESEPGSVRRDERAAEVRRHYESVDESTRLNDSAAGRLEWLRTWDVLHRHLPAPPATVIDVGGAAGAYAVPLAREGFEVHLLDPVERHVRQARTAGHRSGHPLATTVVGDGRRLPYADAMAHTVLLMGALYHLTERPARLQALGEARRVLRPGGVLIAAAISRYASLLDGLSRGMIAEAPFRDIVRRDLADGQHHNPSGNPDWFTRAYFHRAPELESEIRAAGFDVDGVVAVEGPGWLAADLEAWLDVSDRRAVLLDLLRHVEGVPDLFAVSPHLLAVARRGDRDPSDGSPA